MGGHPSRAGWFLPLGNAPPWFALAALASLLLRGLLLWQYLGSPFSRSPVGDEFNYWLWADEILRTGWAPREVFYQGPLFPYSLALARSVFPSFGQVALASAQLFLNWLTCLLLLPLFRRFIGERMALGASCMALFFSPAAFFALKGTNTGLGLLLLTLGLLALPGPGRSGPFRLLAGGALTGLAVLAVPAFLLAIPAVALFLLLRPPGGRRLLSPAAFSAGALLAILPVTASNYLQDRSLVLVSSDTGEAFLQGNNPLATGPFSRIPGISPLVTEERRDAEALARWETGRVLNAQEVSRHFFRKGLDFIGKEPLKWAALEARKLVLLGSGLDVPHEFSLVRERRDFLPLLWGFPLGGTMVLLLASVGLLSSRVRRDLLLPLSVSAGIGAVCLVFYVGNRYAYPSYLFLLPAASAGLFTLPRLAEKPKTAAVLLPVLLMALVAGRWLADPFYEVGDYLPKLAIAWEETGNPEKAGETLERMKGLDPGNPLPWWLAGRMAQRQGDDESALRAFDRALELAPDFQEVVRDRTRLLEERGAP